MQVRKFEAKTMKEALELVRTQLGPDAVILRARDAGRGFGLLGEKSVEVTAAISETTLRKKQFAESRLSATQVSTLRNRPARLQKEFIERSVARYTDAKNTAPSSTPEKTYKKSRPIPNRPSYSEISDENESENLVQSGRRVEEVLEDLDSGFDFEEDHGEINIHEKNPRIQSAIQSAARALLRVGESAAPLVNTSDNRIRQLQSEVEELRRALQKYKEAPRTLTSAHPGAEYGLPYEVSFLFERLQELGISAENTLQLVKAAVAAMHPENLRNRGLLEAWVAKRLLTEVNVSDDPFSGRVHLFLGAPGEGKTSTMAKFMANLVLKKRKKVALLSADTMKIGAAEQIRIYAQILNASFGTIRGSHDWEHFLENHPEVDVIAVDYPGFTLKDNSEQRLLQTLLPPANVAARAHFVQSLTTKDRDAIEIGQRYLKYSVHDVIFTKLDQSHTYGGIFNIQRAMNVPVLGTSSGSRIPADIEFATRENLLNLILKVSTEVKSERSL